MTARVVRATKKTKVDKRLAALRREWREWRTGRALAGWWGVPWCDHARRPDPACEGCGSRALCRDRCAEIEREAARLGLELSSTRTRKPAPALVEGELLALVGDRWVTV